MPILRCAQNDRDDTVTLGVTKICSCERVDVVNGGVALARDADDVDQHAALAGLVQLDQEDALPLP